MFQKVVVGDEGFIQLGKGGLRGLWHKVRALTFSFTHLIHHFNQMKSKLMIRIFKLKKKKKNNHVQKCFRCVHCKIDVSASPSVDLQGDPCCDDCFEKPTGISSTTSSCMVTDIPDLRVKVPGKRAINSAATRALRPAVDELRSKLQKAGIEKAPIPTSTSALALGELGPNPPVSGKTISMPNLSTHSDQSSTPASSLLAPASPSTAPLCLIRKPRTLPDLNPKSTSASPHVLSPSANPVCPKCHLPLFRPTSKTPLRLGTQALDGTTLATLATTGETFHLACLTCDGCDESFADGKYTVLDDCKLCEACVARRDLIAAEARVKQLESGWSKSLAVGKGLGLARAEVARLFPNL